MSRIETIAYGQIDPERVGYAGVSAESRPEHVLAPGDILFSHINSPSQVGKCALYNSEPPVLIHGMNLLRLRCKDDVEPAFVRHLINSPGFKASLQPYINRAVNQASISVRNLSAIEVSLPELDEQRRIAGILDRASAIRARQMSAQPVLLALLDSTFFSFFGDPAGNTFGWRSATVGDIGTVVTGNTPPRAEPRNYGGKLRWAKNDDVRDDGLYVTKPEETLSEVGALRARIAPAGSVLVTCISGSPSAIGRAAIAGEELAFNQQINAVIPESVDTRFLCAQLRLLRPALRRASTGGMKGMISKTALKRIALIIPPIGEQKAFGRAFDAILTQQARADTKSSQLDALFASLQHGAFSGAL